ncbi:hypothetical protein HDU91_002794, partial [Kappamyces sp. JEL0680]
MSSKTVLWIVCPHSSFQLVGVLVLAQLLCDGWQAKVQLDCTSRYARTVLTAFIAMLQTWANIEIVSPEKALADQPIDFYQLLAATPVNTMKRLVKHSPTLKELVDPIQSVMGVALASCNAVLASTLDRKLVAFQQQRLLDTGHPVPEILWYDPLDLYLDIFDSQTEIARKLHASVQADACAALAAMLPCLYGPAAARSAAQMLSQGEQDVIDSTAAELARLFKTIQKHVQADPLLESIVSDSAGKRLEIPRLQEKVRKHFRSDLDYEKEVWESKSVFGLLASDAPCQVVSLACGSAVGAELFHDYFPHPGSRLCGIDLEQRQTTSFLLAQGHLDAFVQDDLYHISPGAAAMLSASSKWMAIHACRQLSNQILLLFRQHAPPGASLAIVPCCLLKHSFYRDAVGPDRWNKLKEQKRETHRDWRLALAVQCRNEMLAHEYPEG